jgi:hypothetical protein
MGMDIKSEDGSECQEREYLEFIDRQLELLKRASHSRKAPDRFYVLRWASLNNKLADGYWAEFGVFEGASTQVLSKAAATRSSAGLTVPNAIYGFDSFRGLPPAESDGRSDWLTHRFDRGGMPPPSLPGVELVTGWFNETVPAFLRRDGVDGRQAALIHIDCDLRSSTFYVLSALTKAGAIGAGTIIVFDELLHYSGYERNELRALWEWSVAFDVEWKWVSYGAVNSDSIVQHRHWR